MRIIQQASKVVTNFGTLEVKVTRVIGLELRKLVSVAKKAKCSSENTLTR